MRGSSRRVKPATWGSFDPADAADRSAREKGGDPARPPPRLSETVPPRFQGRIHCSFSVYTFMVDDVVVLSAASGYRYVYTCCLSYHFSLRQHNLLQHDASSSTRPKVRTDVRDVLVGDLYWNVLRVCITFAGQVLSPAPTNFLLLRKSEPEVWKLE